MRSFGKSSEVQEALFQTYLIRTIDGPQPCRIVVGGQKDICGINHCCEVRAWRVDKAGRILLNGAGGRST